MHTKVGKPASRFRMARLFLVCSLLAVAYCFHEVGGCGCEGCASVVVGLGVVATTAAACAVYSAFSSSPMAFHSSDAALEMWLACFATKK